MSSNGRMGRNPFQKKAPRGVAEEAATQAHTAPAGGPEETLAPMDAQPQMQTLEVNVEAVSIPAEPVQFIAAPSQIQEQTEVRTSDSSELELGSDSEVPSWMKAVAITYRVALLTRFGAQVAVSEAQQFLHERLRQHQQAKRHGRA